MGAVTIRFIGDFDRHDCDLRVRCLNCDHAAIFGARELELYFRERKWNVALEVVGWHMRCSKCGRRGDVSIHGIERRHSVALPPRPRPDIKVPMGIDPRAWARATEAERRAMVRRAR